MKKTPFLLICFVIFTMIFSVDCFASDGSDMAKSIFNIDFISNAVSAEAQEKTISVFEKIDGIFPLPFSFSLAIIALVSIIECFFGYRLIKGQVAVTALFAGYFTAMKFSYILYKIIPSYPEVLDFIAFAIFAIILAAVSSRFYNVGVFSLVFVILYTILPGFIDNNIICIAISLATAIISVILVKFAVITVTSVFFGMLCGLCISCIAGIDNGFLIYLPGIILSALGLLIQFSHEKRVKKKKNKNALKSKA